MILTENNQQMTVGILSVLGYFALFRYPMTDEEIYRFHPVKTTRGKINETLKSMEIAGTICRDGKGFYRRAVDPVWTEVRVSAHEKAMQLLQHSPVYVSIISRFPFVEAVALSGSLSKYQAGQDADFDYFIITTAGRLWIARTLLHIFKKLTFITGHQHCFCMNYFVDTGHLALPDHNIYTAIELATLIPSFNPDMVGELRRQNPWVTGFLPNHPMDPDSRYIVKNSGSLMKSLSEKIFNIAWPDGINRWLMNLTDRKWRKKWSRKGFPMEDYHRAFTTSPGVSKNHPADFQKKILNSLHSPLCLFFPPLITSYLSLFTYL